MGCAREEGEVDAVKDGDGDAARGRGSSSGMTVLRAVAPRFKKCVWGWGRCGAREDEWMGVTREWG